MADRDTAPFGNYNFIVNWGTGTEGDPKGGFSDVSGLSTELTMAEYRNGNFGENYVHKVPGIWKTGDVTLKRGVVKNADFWEWIKDIRNESYTAKKDVTITMLDESRSVTVKVWDLKSCAPMKWTGPTLAGKGGGDVAMEEITLSCERIEETTS